MSAPLVGSAPVEPSGVFRSPMARAAIRFASRIANPVISRIAGKRWFPAFGLVLHRGRRSGRQYVTPVGMGSAGGGLMIPLTFGDRSHWYLNVIAADGGLVRWKGNEIRVGHPKVVPAADVKSAFSPALWLVLRLVGIRNYLRVEPVE